MATYRQTITAAGQNELVLANLGQGINVTRVMVGSGQLAGGADPTAQTALVSPVMNATIGAAVNLGGGVWQLSVVVDSANVTGGAGFSLWELGIFATAGAGAEQLYSYVQTLTNPIYIEPASANSGQKLYLTYYVVFSSAASVTITIASGVYASEQEFQAHIHDPATHTELIAAHNADPNANPAAINKHNTDPNAHAGLVPRFLKTNTTLTVIASGTPDNVTTFSSIQAAHDYLLGFQIYPGIAITINVQAGNYALSSAIAWKHPQGGQITVVGAAAQTVTFTAVTNVDTTHFSVTVTSSTGLAVGMQMLVKGTGLNSQWRGGHTITAISGTTVTLLKNFNGGVDFTTGQTGLSGCVLEWFPSILTCTNCLCVSANTPFNGQNLTVFGSGYNSGYAGFAAFGVNMTLNNVLVYGASSGAYVATAALTLNGDTCFWGCQWGLVATASGSIGTTGDVYVNGNAGTGVWVQVGSAASLGANAAPATNRFFASANATGILASSNSTVSLGNTWILINGYGLDAQNGAVIVIGAYTANPIVITGNVTFDAHASNRGSIFGSVNSGGSIVTYSPANNALGNNQAFIATT